MKMGYEMIKKNKALIVTIVLLLMHYLVSFEMNVVLPLGPNIAQYYNVKPENVTYLNILYSVFGLIAPYIGLKADLIGQKKIILVSAFSFFMGTLMISFSNSVLFYVLGRGLTGITLATLMAMGMSYLMQLSNPEKYGKISGLFRIAQGLAVFSAPMIGSILFENYGFKSIYFILTILILILMITFYFIAPNTELQNEPVKFKVMLKSLNNKNERLVLLSTFFIVLPAVLFFSYLSVYLFMNDTPPETITLLYTITALGSIIGGTLVTFLADKFNMKHLLLITLILTSSSLVFFYISDLNMKYLFGFLFGLSFDASNGLIFPIGGSIVRKYQATFMSLMSLMISLSTILNNVMGPTLFKLGGFGLITIVNATSVLIGLFIVTKIKINRLEKV